MLPYFWIYITEISIKAIIYLLKVTINKYIYLQPILFIIVETICIIYLWFLKFKIYFYFKKLKKYFIITNN